MKKFLVASQMSGRSGDLVNPAYVCSSDPWNAVKKYIELCLARGFTFEDEEMEFRVEECA